MGIMCRTRKVDQYLQTPTETGREEEKGYFRIYSWNSASANRRGAVLEKMVLDFDVVCLQETRTCPNRPQVLQDFAVIQRHKGRDMEIVVSLMRWKTNWETQKRYAVISMHDQVCGIDMAPTSREAEEALSDVLFTLSAASPTHHGARQADTDSTIDLAPWSHAETLASPGSDNLPVVFSLHEPRNEPRLKPSIRPRMASQAWVQAASLQANSHNKFETESRHPTTLAIQGNPSSVD